MLTTWRCFGRRDGAGEVAVREIEAAAAAAGSGIGRSSMLCPGER
jgi:hypothetical protein